MKFTGIQCALDALGAEIETQLHKDKCICAACYLGFNTLYRSVEKNYTLTRKQVELKKEIDRYWVELKLRNKIGATSVTRSAARSRPATRLEARVEKLRIRELPKAEAKPRTKKQRENDQLEALFHASQAHKFKGEEGV